MLTNDQVVAYDAAAALIANELARNTSLTAAASKSAARSLLTRFASAGISLTGIPNAEVAP